MKILRVTLASLALACAAGCSEEPPPPSVDAFMQDPILLDATMVRCVANRHSVNYDPECVHAREAVERIAAAEEAARRAALEAESERKRDARRREQEAADEARRQAAELERQRQEAELLGLVPPSGEGSTIPAATAATAATVATPVEVNAPRVEIEEPLAPAPLADAEGTGGVAPPDAGAPETLREAGPEATDLGEIREELNERRQAVPPESS